MNLAGSSPEKRAATQQGQANVERLQRAAAKGASPALDNVGSDSQDEALLSYLMGNG
jgi:hypothetical protein